MASVAESRLHGRYELEEALSPGSAGVMVFRARDTTLNRDLAIKVLPGGRPSLPVIM